MLVSVTLSGDQRLVARLDRMPAALHVALVRKVTALSLMLQGYIQSKKLSGQVLNVVTGALRRSIHNFVEEQDLVVTGGVRSSGDVKYAAAHEFGFEGDVQVRQHMRSVVYGREVEPFSVGPYSRHMKVPERSFMRSGLADKAEYITAELKQTVVDVMIGRAQ